MNTTGFEHPQRAAGSLELQATDTLHRYYVQRLFERDGKVSRGWVPAPLEAQSPWQGHTDIDLAAVGGTADYDSTGHEVEYRHGRLTIGSRPGALDGGGTVLKPTHRTATGLYGVWEAYHGLASHLDRKGHPIVDDGYFCAVRLGSQ